MKSITSTLLVLVLLCSVSLAQQPEPMAASPTKLGAPTKLRHFSVTIQRYDPANGGEGGDTFVLPVDCIDEEHAISATISNAVAFTKKWQGGVVVPVAFRCVSIQEQK